MKKNIVFNLFLFFIFSAQKGFLKNSPHNVQTNGEGGGVKGFLNNV